MASLNTYAQNDILNKNLRIEVKQWSVSQLIEYITDETGVLFSYSTQQIEARKTIELKTGEQGLKEVLNLLFDQYDIDHLIVENQVILKHRKKEKIIEFKQELYTISGYLYDGTSGESLIGATVSVTGTYYGTISNAFGFYSLSLPEGSYSVQFNYLSFEQRNIRIDLKNNLIQSVYLKPSRITLPSVLIKTDQKFELLEKSQMSRLDLKVDQMKKIPEFGGEIGLVKGIQTLPGIKSHSDGSAFFSVRGGSKGQNLIIIDDAPVYNPSHLFGYYSMIVPDFTQDIKIYKSDVPVNLGDRLSSVIDIRTRDGNLKHFRFTGLLNPIVSRFSLEGPIIKEKSSFFTSLRFSNFQWLYKQYVPNLEFGFNDLNIKWNYAPNPKNRFFFSFFNGGDRLLNQFAESNSAGIEWNNTAMTFRWNYVLNQQTFVNTMLIGSLYQYRLFLGNNSWRSNIGNVSLKTDFSYYPRPDLDIKYGLNISNHAFDPGSLSLSGQYQFIPSVSSGKSTELNLYFKTDYRFDEKWSMSGGVRMPMWSNTGPTVLYYFDDLYALEDTVHIGNSESYRSFVNLDPRISVSYRIDSTHSFKFSYGAYHQYIHQLSNTTSPFTSIEVWIPSGVNVSPQRADQFVLGWYGLYKKAGLQMSTELYYKYMNNQIDYIPHANMLINPLVEGELRFGRSRAYGIEWQLEKKQGDLQGWVNYTYSRVFRKTMGINDGKIYRSFWDRPHDFSIFMNYAFSDRSSMSANWSYYTGSPITLPEAFYTYNDQSIPVYGDKNNARLPDYHRLDLSYKYQLNKAGKRFKHSLNFSIYNVYGQKNPVSINYNKIEKDGNLVVPGNLLGNSDLLITQRDLMRFMPSISYKFEL